MSSYLLGTLGALFSWMVGRNLGLTWADSALCVGAANLAAVTSGILTLRAEKVTWLKATLLRGWVGTWACLVVLFFGVQLGLNPFLRDPKVFWPMALPLILSTGLCIRSVFGPLQDWIVRRSQKKR